MTELRQRLWVLRASDDDLEALLGASWPLDQEPECATCAALTALEMTRRKNKDTIAPPVTFEVSRNQVGANLFCLTDRCRQMWLDGRREHNAFPEVR